MRKYKQRFSPLMALLIIARASERAREAQNSP